MGKLVHCLADGSTVEIKLNRQRITIGRRADNDLCLPYPAVSGEHAAVVTILADSFLEDLGSTNGTLVNGTAVTKHFLRDLDHIDVGRRMLVYLVDDAATLERPSGRRESAEGSRQHDSKDGTLADSDAEAVLLETTAAVGAPMAGSNGTPLPGHRREVEPALKVVSGAKAGRIVALVKDETLIGRAGVQVVALRRGTDELRVVPVEGATPPSVNGIAVIPEGRSLAVGDVLEVAGARLEVMAGAKVPSA